MNQIVESKEMEMPTPLIFTDNAVKKVKALIEEEEWVQSRQIKSSILTT